MKESPIHIVCAIDDSFKLPLSAMIASLFETNRRNKIKLHLFSANLSEENVLFFEQLSKSYNKDFEFYKLDLTMFKDFPVDERISYAAYYRLVVPEVIDPEAKQYIYLDADIIIQRDLRRLFETDLGDNVIGAINDIIAVRDKYYLHHNISEDFLYFNSGVLLVNVDNWKAHNTTKNIRDYLINNFKECIFHDQDGLNGILHSKRLSLSPEWNQQVGIYFLDKDFLIDVYGKEEYLMGLNSPAVIHFNGWEKPWHFLCGHKHRDLFTLYLHKSGLKLEYKDITIKNRLKMLRYKIFGWEKISKKYYVPLDIQLSN